MTTPGSYPVIYSFNGVSMTATVTVAVDHTAVDVRNSNHFVGDSWSPADNFVSVTDASGNVITDYDVVVAAGLTVSGTPDMNIPGSYKVTYTLGDVERNAIITVKVKDDNGDNLGGGDNSSASNGSGNNSGKDLTDSGNQNKVSKIVYPKYNKWSFLPSTCEVSEMFFSTIGAVLLSSTAIVLFFNKRLRKNK